MSPEVIFLAFANSKTNPLDTLSTEDHGVFTSLVAGMLRGYYIVHRESQATVDNINNFLQTYVGRIAIFHYSGHAKDNVIQVGEELSNTTGIALQLQKSINDKVLKLVVVNGCCSRAIAKKFLGMGVPAVIATNAPVEDYSATRFAIRFYQNLGDKRMSIRAAFTDALGPAQASMSKDLGAEQKITRHIDFFDQPDTGEPLWELFSLEDSDVGMSPLPHPDSQQEQPYEPNQLLIQTLFESLHREEHPRIMDLRRNEENNVYVELADKQNAIVNALPFPTGIHLQKLFSPSDDDPEGYDKVSVKRIRQISEVFHTTMELFGFAMLSQLWDLKLHDMIRTIPDELVTLLRKFFFMTAAERSVFDYIPLIRTIRQTFDSLHDGAGVEYFIEELNVLKTLATDGHRFANACKELTVLRAEAINETIPKDAIPDKCRKGEESLASFFTDTGFLHRYNLTSIQDIDILKGRHEMHAQYRHSAIKLMRAVGKPDRLYYMSKSCLDNPGVMLLKGDLTQIQGKPGYFFGANLKFLNLSPFVIDRNAFEPNADLTNLMFFEQHNPRKRTYSYRSVKRPDSLKDKKEILPGEAYLTLQEEFTAFQVMILAQP